MRDELTGGRAVEVVEMFGDAIVGVKHCVDPRSGKVRRATWAMCGLAAVCLLAFALSFGKALHDAAANERTQTYETNVLGKPDFAVRLRVLPVGYDLIALGGLLGSLVLGTLALARLRKETESACVRIGTAPDVEFPIEHAPAASFVMIAPIGDAFAFHFGRGMEGELTIDGQQTTLAELATHGRTTIDPIPANATLRVRVGNVTFVVSSVSRPRRHPYSWLAGLERRLLGYFAGSLAVHLGFWFLIREIPLDGGGIGFSLASLDETSTRSNSTNVDDVPPLDEDEPEDGGTPMALDAIKVGEQRHDPTRGTYKIQQHDSDPQLARTQLEHARTAGILGSSALADGGAFASLTGTGEIASGFDDTNIYGGLLGNETGEMNGGFGFGRSGFGPGGGGTSWGTIGTGRYGTMGRGSGHNACGSVCGGRLGMRGRSAAVPTVSIGQPDAIGDLDKAIIRRYIRRNLQKVTYCYEKQLQVHPGLAGTVQAQFFITPTGNVASSSAAGVNSEVANCIADVIKDIEFPKPDGGGAQVQYPFTFRPAGA